MQTIALLVGWALTVLSTCIAMSCTGAPCAAQVQYCAVPHGARDWILSAVPTKSGALLQIWNPSDHQIAARQNVDFQVHHVIAIGRWLVLADNHSLYVDQPDLKHPVAKRWHTSLDILRVARIGKGWLVLAAKAGRSEHPKKGQVYWFRSAQTRAPQRLSLREIYNFWDIQAGDVDGDGTPCIALNTWSKTSLIRRYARRYFIYGLTRKDAYPRWRGSRLSKPYLSARLVRLGPGTDTKLLSVEQTDASHSCAMLYQWDEFGFFGMGKSPRFRTGAVVANDYDIPLLRLVGESDDSLVKPGLQHGLITLKPICRLGKSDVVSVGRFTGKRLSILVTPNISDRTSDWKAYPL